MLEIMTYLLGQEKTKKKETWEFDKLPYGQLFGNIEVSKQECNTSFEVANHKGEQGMVSQLNKWWILC
jgi:hypothetical protein